MGIPSAFEKVELALECLWLLWCEWIRRALP